jgi:hypothetical protein
MTSIPVVAFAVSRDLMMKSENVRKTPPTTAQAMIENWQTMKNHVDIMFSFQGRVNLLILNTRQGRQGS